jgi:hypothetical protein
MSEIRVRIAVPAFMEHSWEHYQTALAAYTAAINAAKSVHGEEFYQAQLRVVEAQMNYERACRDVGADRRIVH